MGQLGKRIAAPAGSLLDHAEQFVEEGTSSPRRHVYATGHRAGVIGCDHLARRRYGATTDPTTEANVTDKLDDVWASRDFPVLVEVTRRIDSGEQFTRIATIADALGRPVDDVVLAANALERRGLVKVGRVMRASASHFDDVSAEAYFLTGLHPSGDDAVSALVQALRQAADLAPDPEEKSRLRALADGALGISRDVLGGVLVAVASRGMLGA